MEGESEYAWRERERVCVCVCVRDKKKWNQECEDVKGKEHETSDRNEVRDMRHES